MSNKANYKREWRKHNPDKVHAEYVRRLERCPDRHREINRRSVRKYAASHRDRINTRVRAWYKRVKANPKKVMTPEERKEAQRLSRQRHAYKDYEVTKAYRRTAAKKWRELNPTKCKVWDKLKRARRRGALGSCTPEQWMARVAYFGHCCRYCRKHLTSETLTADHMIPIVRGGSNWASNIVPCCKSCNSSKRGKTFTEYIAWRLMKGLR